MRITNLILTAVLTVAAASAAFGQTTVEANAKAPTGTWLTTVTPPAEAGVPAFKLNFTFLSDRNLLASGTGGEFPALGNPCQGTWVKTGSDEITVTYICFDYDANLQYTGYDKLRGRLTFDSEQGLLTGRIGLTNYDTEGKEVFSACCADVDGTRLEVERLEDQTRSVSRSELHHWH